MTRGRPPHRALLAWRRELCEDLGGEAAVSAQGVDISRSILRAGHAYAQAAGW